MPDLLVVVLDVGVERVVASLADVDSPGEVLSEAGAARTGDLAVDAASVLGRLGAHDLGARLLALAVGVAADVRQDDAVCLLDALGDELPAGWPLPAALPVVPGRVEQWAASGAQAVARPVVAGAVLAAARSTGAHAHLPRARGADAAAREN